MPHKMGVTLATALVLASAGIFGFAFETVAQTLQSVSAGGTDLSAQQAANPRLSIFSGL